MTPDRWNHLVDLFQRRGPRGGAGLGEGGCWCMWWRERGRSREENKRAMRDLVREGREPGLLAYVDETPVGWVSVGPRQEFGQLVRSRTYRPLEDEPGVWSIVCFYVHASSRREGVAKRLLAAAVDYALRRGASVVEAYPHVRGDYMGAPALFEELGFEPVRPAGPRVIMRYVSAGRPRARARGRAGPSR